MSDSTLLNAVADVARLAGNAALSHFGKHLAIESKADGSPVTIADRAAERVARDWIEARFPNDGVVGEELGERRGTSGRRWIIDPIDGTKSFVRGVPLWGTLIAVANDDTILAGATFCPGVDELLVAAVGQGCWWNGARASVSKTTRIADATVLTTDERFRGAPERRDAWQRLADASAVARSWGDCYGYLLVATGRADIMVDGILADWDAAALMPAITEAGGVFTDWRGQPTAFGRSAIATNLSLADPARTLLGVQSTVITK